MKFWSSLLFLPQQASSTAGQVDALYLYLIGVCLFFALLIFVLVAVFSIKYRRRSDSERPKPIHGNHFLEMLWTIVPFFFVMSFFIGGMVLYFGYFRPPAHSLEIFVVGKQWMWKLQHPSGPREINELHVPVNYPVKLTLTSEDVIHSFYVPAFRIKMDAVPGRYTRTWFKATQTGDFHLFCAEFCGTEHSKMIGKIHVMEMADYQKWLSERTGKNIKIQTGTMPTAVGEELFQKYRCIACHHATAGALGPDLTKAFGSEVKLADGKTVKVDEAYIQESLKNPTAKIVEGYAPLMPTYENILSEEQIFAIIEYLKHLPSEGTQPAAEKKS